jgi:hypothetical protein
MVKVFYVGGSASTNGMLRAVLLSTQVAELAVTQKFTYIGARFPPQGAGDPPVTTVEVTEEQGQITWRAGFYRAERAPVQFEEILRSLRD